MGISRRDFVRLAGLGAAATAAGAISAVAGTAPDGPQATTGGLSPEERGIHPVLERDHPYIFIDSCMQIWPDARFEDAHRYGATVYGVTAWDPHLDVDQALEGLMFWHRIARTHPHLAVVLRAEDIPVIKKNGRAGLLLASQCGDFIGDKLHRLEAFYRLGLRMLIPAYSTTNRLCGGCLDKADGGLTSLGELVVKECNRLGLLLDCSHVGFRSGLEIIESSRLPVVFSHSGADALAENPRNVDDRRIKACAAKGGVIGLAPWGPMLLKKGGTKRPTVDDYIDHIDHVAQLTGSTDPIGVGTDMSLGTYPEHQPDPWGSPALKDVAGAYDKHVTANFRSPLRMAEGFSNYAEVVNFADRLGRRGYKDADIRKILGGNYLRVFAQVWK
jgi:membrane dipeptidase